MFIKSEAVNPEGIIDDRYGAKGKEFKKGMPSHSMPFTIHDYPEGTASFAVVFDDHDAVPVCGFTWIHWTVANLKRPYMEENESVEGGDFVQGVNSWHSCASDLNREDATGYGGPSPPNGKHTYNLKVFALNTELPLKDGFYLSDLMNFMDGHVLAHAKLQGTYSP